MGWDVLGLAVKVKGEGVKETSHDLSGLDRSLESVEKAFKDLRSTLGGTNRALDETDKKAKSTKASLSTFKNVLAGLGVGIAVKKMFDFGGAVLKTGAQFEQLGLQMKAVMGSEGAAKAATDWVTKFTADTPYQIEQVSQSFIKLKAMGLDPMNGTMQAIADQTSMLGGDFEIMETITTALGKAWTKGKMQGEELMMMMDRGVPVVQYLADALGVSESAIFKMSEQGKIGREEIGKLIDKMGEMTSGASANLMDSLTGKWSNLKDTITLTLNEIAFSGGMDAAKEGLTDLIDAIQGLRDSGAIEQFGKVFGNTLKAILTAAKFTFIQLPLLVKLYVDKATKYFLEFIVAVKNLADKVATTTIALMYATGQNIDPALKMLGIFNDLVLGADDVIRELNIDIAEGEAALAALKDSGEKAADTITEVGGAAKGAKPKVKELTDEEIKLQKAWDKFFKEWGKTGKAVMNEIGSSMQTLLTGVTNFAGLAKDVEWSGKTVYEALAKQNAEARVSATLFADLGLKAKDVAEWLLGMGWDVDETRERLKHFDLTTADAVLTMEDLERIAELSGLSVYELLVKLGRAPDNVKGANDAFKGLNDTLADSEYYAALFQNELANMFDQAFQDLISGEIEDLGDLFEFAFGTLGQVAGKAFTKELALVFTGEQSFKDMIGKWSEGGVAGALGGAGMVYQGYQAGGAGGFISGVMGGVMAGASISGGNPYAMAIGGIIGGVAALFGGGSDESPETQFGIGGGGLSVGIRTRGGQGISPEENQVYVQQMRVLYRETFLAYRDALKAFGDASLYDLIGELPEVGGATWRGMSVKELFDWLGNAELPRVFSSVFEDAFAQGFKDLGVSDEFFAALNRELSLLPGDQRLEALITTINAVKTLNEILATDFATLTDEMLRNPMDTLLLGVDDFISALDLMSMGFEDMTPSERAREIANLAGSFENLKAAVGAMIREIDSARDAISSLFGGIREDIMLEGMSEYQKAQYYRQQIEDLTAQLSQAETPQEIMSLSQEIAGYINAMRGLGVEFFDPMGYGYGGETLAEYINRALDTAETAAQERLDFIEQTLREAWDRATEAVGFLADEFYDFAGWLDEFLGGGDESGGGGGSPVDPDDPTGYIPWWKDPESLNGMGQAFGDAVNLPTPVVNVYVYSDGTVQHSSGYQPPPYVHGGIG